MACFKFGKASSAVTSFICCLLFHQLFGDWESHLRRIMKLIAGGGLSITGSHNMCGDYLYSGHTVILTLTYLFIKECKYVHQESAVV